MGKFRVTSGPRGSRAVAPSGGWKRRSGCKFADLAAGRKRARHLRNSPREAAERVRNQGAHKRALANARAGGDRPEK
jgi:hypothetical protein